jgi:hypothetical protein
MSNASNFNNSASNKKLKLPPNITILMKQQNSGELELGRLSFILVVSNRPSTASPSLAYVLPILRNVKIVVP